tara:strand:- start:375 stop:485 length:111 start_codon:yes stop_codon:yes gene_type:complete
MSAASGAASATTQSEIAENQNENVIFLFLRGLRNIF